MTKKAKIQYDIKTQRRFLKFINDAQHPRDLAIPITTLEKNVLRIRHRVGAKNNVRTCHKEGDIALIMDVKIAQKLIDARNELNPVYGFQSIQQMVAIINFDISDWWLNWICPLFGTARNGSWKQLDYCSIIKVAQAALVHTPDDNHKGRVLLIEQVFGDNHPDEETYSRTPLWKPEGTTEDNAFEENSPHPPGLSPAVAHNTFEEGEGNLYCSDHAFLTDGSLLAVGGGGQSGPPPDVANMAWIFNPKLKEWHPTYDKSAGHGNFTKMHYGRWYPTAISLGDDAGRVLIVGGLNDDKTAGQTRMEIYSESTGEFSHILGEPGVVPDLTLSPITWDYPNLHLLRNGTIFHSRAMRTQGGDGPASFSFTSYGTGEWSFTGGVAESTSAMGSASALLIGDAGEPDRVILAGKYSNEVRVIEVPPSSSTPWQTYTFPDGLSRNRVNMVLLPDGTVLLAGGTTTGTECYIFDPAQTGGDPFTAVDNLNVGSTDGESTHYQVMLLPDARVAAFGAANQAIEIFTPPYLYNTQCDLVDRPEITDWPNPDNEHHILHGQTFTIHSPQAAEIGRAVLVQPMSVTHQMDTGQRVLPLCFTHNDGDELEILVPDGRVYPYGNNIHTHSFIPRGMYMLFILNNKGVPSEARFVLLR